MKNNNLVSNSGLSLSQAQSISNLCNQRATEIGNKLKNVNNVSKTVKVNGEVFTTVQAKKLPENVIDLLKEKANLHACQAYLMENLMAKETMLKEAKNAKYVLDNGLKGATPEKPVFIRPTIISEVEEEYGWEQLTAKELAEFFEVEAYAAHIGQYIHGPKSVLGGLREELPSLSTLEWMSVKDGEKTPVTVTIHHNSDDLLKIHEELAALHRTYEQRTNYFKSKVKNLTTERNAEIAKLNADEQNKAEKVNNDLQMTFDTEMKKAYESINSAKAEFERTRQAQIKEIAAMRIEIDPRYQKTIDIFLPKTEPKPE